MVKYDGIFGSLRLDTLSAASCYEKAGDLNRAVNLYRAALSGPLREDTRAEVENMLSACLVALNHQSLESISSIHLSSRWG